MISVETAKVGQVAFLAAMCLTGFWFLYGILMASWKRNVAYALGGITSLFLCAAFSVMAVNLIGGGQGDLGKVVAHFRFSVAGFSTFGTVATAIYLWSVLSRSLSRSIFREFVDCLRGIGKPRDCRPSPP